MKQKILETLFKYAQQYVEETDTPVDNILLDYLGQMLGISMGGEPIPEDAAKVIESCKAELDQIDPS